MRVTLYLIAVALLTLIGLVVISIPRLVDCTHGVLQPECIWPAY